MEVTEVSELTATAMSICPFCPIIIISSRTTNHNFASARQVLRSSAKLGSTGAGDRDRRRFHKGGGGVPRSAYFVQLPYVRSGHHQEKLPWSSISKYIGGDQFLVITCLLSCWITFIVALCRNGQSCTLSPQLVLVCKFNAHDAQTKGTLAKFDSPGQSLVKTAPPRHDYYKFRPKSISELVELYLSGRIHMLANIG